MKAIGIPQLQVANSKGETCSPLTLDSAIRAACSERHNDGVVLTGSTTTSWVAPLRPSTIG